MANKQEARIQVDGMHCAGCVARVTAALTKLASVDVKEVQVGSAAVLYDASLISRQQIAGAINKIGFQARPEE
jgi:copper chaperone